MKKPIQLSAQTVAKMKTTFIKEARSMFPDMSHADASRVFDYYHEHRHLFAGGAEPEPSIGELVKQTSAKMAELKTLLGGK